MTEVSSSTIRVMWDTVPAVDQNGFIVHYDVEYTSQSNITHFQLTVSLYAQLVGLEENAEYSIRVRAYTNVGPGPYSALVRVTTLRESKHVYIKCLTTIRLHVFDFSVMSVYTAV